MYQLVVFKLKTSLSLCEPQSERDTLICLDHFSHVKMDFKEKKSFLQIYWLTMFILQEEVSQILLLIYDFFFLCEQYKSNGNWSFQFWFGPLAYVFLNQVHVWFLQRNLSLDSHIGWIASTECLAATVLWLCALTNVVKSSPCCLDMAQRNIGWNLFLLSHSRHDPTTSGSNTSAPHISIHKYQPLLHKKPYLKMWLSPHPRPRYHLLTNLLAETVDAEFQGLRVYELSTKAYSANKALDFI